MTNPTPNDRMPPSKDDDAPENEVMREIRHLKEQAAKAATTPDPAHGVSGQRGSIGWRTAAGIGIGSAALMAALLYASRKRD